MKKKILIMTCCAVMLACGCGKSADAPAEETTEVEAVSDADVDDEVDSEDAIEAGAGEEEADVIEDVEDIENIENIEEEDIDVAEEIDPDSIEHIIDYFPEQKKISTIEEAAYDSLGIPSLDTAEHDLYYLDCDFLMTELPDDAEWNTVTRENYYNIFNYVLADYMEKNGLTDDNYVSNGVMYDFQLPDEVAEEVEGINNCSYIVGEYLRTETVDDGLMDIFIISHTSTCQDNQVQVLIYTQQNLFTVQGF